MNGQIQNPTKLTRLLLIACVAIASFIILALILAKIWPWGSDFLLAFYPLGEKWLAGHHAIYDLTVPDVFYPPWSLFIFVPLALLPIQLAHGFLLASSLVLMLVAVRLLQPSRPFPFLFVLLSLVNLHSFDLYIRGQVDAFVLLGVALGYWAIRNRRPFWLSLAFCLIVMKPPLNVSLVLVLYLISIRQWSKREWLITFSAPLVMLVVSSLMVGLDWPIMFIQNVTPRITYLSISIWHMVEQLGLPYWPVAVLTCLAVFAFLRLAWQENTTPFTLSIALATTLMFTVYANGNHYILLIPAFLYVIQRSLKIGLLAFAVTFTPLLRLIWGPPASSIDLLYPTILLIGSYYVAGKFDHLTMKYPPFARKKLDQQIASGIKDSLKVLFAELMNSNRGWTQFANEIALRCLLAEFCDELMSSQVLKVR